MLQFTIDTDGFVIGITDAADRDMKQIIPDNDKAGGIRVVNRNDFDTYDYAYRVAVEANRWLGIDVTRDIPRFLPVDRGNSVSPRYDIIEMPQLREPVSRSFNGDTYPCGYITKISASLRRIETDDGTVFYGKQVTGDDGVKRHSGMWKETGGTFSLVHGHHDRRNPCF